MTLERILNSHHRVTSPLLQGEALTSSMLLSFPILRILSNFSPIFTLPGISNFKMMFGFSFFLSLLQVLRSFPRAAPHPHGYCRISRYLRYFKATQRCTKCRPSNSLQSITLYSSILLHLKSPSFKGMPRVGNHLDACVSRSSWCHLSSSSTFFSIS